MGGIGSGRVPIDIPEEAVIDIISSQKRKFRKNQRHRDNNEFRVEISPVPEIELNCEVGMGDNTLDLSGLNISELNVETGMSDTEVIVEQENKKRVKRIVIENGMGALRSDHLGNLIFDELDVETGMGEMTLDLRGFKGEGFVDVEVGMGSCTIYISRDVGVKLFYDKNFMSSVDFDDFEKVSRRSYKSENYDSKTSFLEIDAEVGMGSIDIVWKN